MNSDISDVEMADLLSEVEKEAQEREEKVKAYNDKKLEVEIFKTENQHKKIQEAVALQQNIKDLDLQLNEEGYVDKLVQANTTYLKAIKEKVMPFFNEDFDGVIPYMPNNLILVGARTGRGKSTTAANLTYQALMQGKRVLNISNEEKAIDVINRVTCLIKDEPYTDHAKFTEAQVEEFNKYIRILSNKLLVIDDEYVSDKSNISVGGAGVFEVVKGYLDKAVEQKMFDVILIDYYQKVNQSSENPQLNAFEVQAKFADYMGDILKHPNCPAIVLMAQLKPDDKEGKPIEERIEGRRTILKPPTAIVEARPDYDRRCTQFHIYKTRWSEFNGKDVDVGYVKGKYVKYDKAFQQYVDKQKMEEAQRKIMAQVKPENNANGD